MPGQQLGRRIRRHAWRRIQTPFGGPPDPGLTFGSGIRPRCSFIAFSGNGVPPVTVISPPLAGWSNAGLGVSGNAPQPGDLVIMVVSLFRTGTVITQTGGTGTWTIQATSPGSDNTNAPTAGESIVWRIFDGTETPPTFGLTSPGARMAYEVVAIAPDAGNTISIDAWGTELLDVAALTHTVPSATATGTGELSLLLGSFFVSPAGSQPAVVTWPAGWTDLQDVYEAGTALQHVQTTSIAYQSGVGSGTIAPGSVANSLSSSAILDHVLIKQVSAGGGTVSGAAALHGGQGRLTNVPSLQFASIGLNGVGTVNTMTRNASGVMVGGGDTHGYYRSTDDGDHWESINHGVGGVGVSDSFRQSACVVWSVTEANTLYSGVGESAIGNDGGLLVSTDGGSSWSLRTSVPQFSGNHGVAPVPSGGEPRSTGRLLAQDNGFLFAAPFKQGVLRSANGGTDNFPVTCTMAGSAPGTNYYVRSLIADPNNPGTLYAACYDQSGTGAFGKVWKCTADTVTTPNFTQLTAAPATVEELCIVGTYIYAAAGASGIFRSVDGGTTWASLNGGFVGTAGNDWTGIDGYVDGSGNHVIIASDGNPSAAAACAISLTITPGGAVSYANLTGSVQLSTLPPDSRTWWNTGGTALGRVSWQNGFVMIDASDLANVKLFICGPGGFFRNIGGTGWTVASNGQGGFPARSIAADPRDANHFQLTSTDWGTHDISDGVAHDASTTLNIGTPSGGQQGYGVSFDPGDSTVYAAFGDKGVAPTWGTNSSGQVCHRATGSSTWTTDGPSVAGKVALGLCALRDSGGTTKLLLAAVWNSGIWRGVWGGASFTWTQVSSAFCNTSAAPGGGNQFIFAHPAGSQYVYLFDPDKGVYRSNDYGVTWVQVWAITTADKNSLAVTASETIPGEIWVTADGSLYKITGAHTGTVAGATATVTGPLALPGSASGGCLAASPDGTIYVSTEDTPGSAGTQIFATPDHGGTWLDAVGDGSLALANSRPVQMVVAADGRLYLAGSNVVTQGYPVTLSIPAAATLTGGAGLLADRAVQLPPATLTGGGGTLTTHATQLAPATLAGGGGTIAAAGAVLVPGTAALTGGAGTLTAAGTSSGTVSATLTGGAGTLTGTATQLAPATLTGGGGTLGDAATQLAPATLTGGGGTLTARVTQLAPATLTGGAGALTDAAVQLAPATLTGGAGTLGDTVIQLAPASLAGGAGTLTAAGTVGVPGAAALAGGAGTLVGTATQLAPATLAGGPGVLTGNTTGATGGAAALTGGGGTLGALATELAVAILTGGGGTLAAPGVQLAGSVLTGGGGQLGDHATQLAPATLTGGGGILAASAGGAAPGTATLTGGAGILAASGALAGAASLAGGPGSLTGRDIQLAPATLTGGAGTMTAGSTQRLAGAATLAGGPGVIIALSTIRLAQSYGFARTGPGSLAGASAGGGTLGAARSGGGAVR